MANVMICRFWDDDGKLKYTEVAAKETNTRFTILPPNNCNSEAFDYATFLPKYLGYGGDLIKYPHTKAEAYKEFTGDMLSSINNSNKNIRSCENLLKQAEKMFNERAAQS